MVLTPYAYHPTTPPQEDVSGLTHSRNTSGSSVWGQLSPASSVESVETHRTTPSPVRLHGPLLLPRIRTQDQTLEPSSFQATKVHRRALSNTYNPPGRAPPARPTPYRSTTSPPECISLISPTSSISTLNSGLHSALNSAVNSPITLTPSYRRRDLGHARSTSASSIDDVTLGKFGYPYRGQPAYITGGYYSPSVIPGQSIFTPPSPVQRNRLQPYNLPEEQQCDAPDEATMTLNEYLRGPNPQPNIVRQMRTVLGRGMKDHYWWDIRNLRCWDDFSLETILEIPAFPDLLSLPVNASAFPKPSIAQSRLHPESESSLVEIVRDSFMVKVNAALKLTINAYRPLAMRVCTDREGPDFVSNYQNENEKTLAGNGRGHVVGLVKSFEKWNTGMRLEAPNKKVWYLEGLAHLHHWMRKHQCRYGFIITETELVIARAATDESDMPLFGALELAPTIETRTQDGLTACLALWYLHMLAKDEPLPGQRGWKLDVQAPVAMTRTNIMEEKDKWIPEPQIGEKRDAKRHRGWVMPGDPFNRRREGAKAPLWNR